eukprot:TRINITY_DN44527_c0_g1_i1.p1 TRINITY_DN44527_c0_g1~~TRINITY_DN44527_c0_g1_i1.p1  ORF type:complete len:454 (+),score=59.51 TRINITY_DN44527_c0_g1_i1:51-1412(+)
MGVASLASHLDATSVAAFAAVAASAFLGSAISGYACCEGAYVATMLGFALAFASVSCGAVFRRPVVPAETVTVTVTSKENTGIVRAGADLTTPKHKIEKSSHGSCLVGLGRLCCCMCSTKDERNQKPVLQESTPVDGLLPWMRVGSSGNLGGSLEKNVAPLGRRQDLPERILEAHVAGRSIEAARILDAFGDDAAVSPARRIRLTASAVMQTFTSLREARQATQDKGSAWKEVCDGGFELLYKYERNSGRLDFIGQASLNVNPFRLWVVLREFDLSPSFMPTTKTCKSLATIDAESEFYHSVNKPFLPMMPQTEAYMERTYVDILEDFGALMILAESVKPGATDHEGCPVPPTPHRMKRISSQGRDILTPLAANRTALTVSRRLEAPFRFLPDMAVRKAIQSFGQGLFSRLNSVVTAWEDSSYAARAETGSRAAHYTDLQKRVEAAVGRQMAA